MYISCSTSFSDYNWFPFVRGIEYLISCYENTFQQRYNLGLEESICLFSLFLKIRTISREEGLEVIMAVCSKYNGSPDEHNRLAEQGDVKECLSFMLRGEDAEEISQERLISLGFTGDKILLSDAIKDVYSYYAAGGGKEKEFLVDITNWKQVIDDLYKLKEEI